ncbi:MAG: hypothetical protein ACLUOI_38090, partial [Eisenbergiella sp.]
MDRKACFLMRTEHYMIFRRECLTAREAVARLRRRAIWPSWHRAGRSFVLDELESMRFDGIIAACGTYLEQNGTRLFSKEPDPETAWKSVEILRAHGMVPVMEGPDYMYFDKEEYTKEVDWFADLVERQLGDRYRPIHGNERSMKINKISAKVRPGSDPDEACRELADWYDPIRHFEGMAGGTVEL